MSDFDEFEFNSDDLGDIGLTGDKKSDDNAKDNRPSGNSSDNKKDEDDDFKLPELPQTKQKNLSIINFSALKPPTGSSITISDATNDSLNFSRTHLMPARLTSMASTPSQNQTSAEGENKPKFELPPLFDDLGDDDDDSNEDDQPNLGPIQFPTDLDKKDPSDTKESKEKMDSITINSVSNNTSIFANANKTIPDSPLQKDNFSDHENDDNFKNDNVSNNPPKNQFMTDLTTSQSNDLNVLDNFGDEIDMPHPLIPSRKALSTSSFPSQSPMKLNHSASKPSFLNINEIKNIKPGEALNSNAKENNNDDLFSMTTPPASPLRSPASKPITVATTTKVSSENENESNNDNEDKNVQPNVMDIDNDNDNEFSSMSFSLDDEDDKTKESKKSSPQSSDHKQENLQKNSNSVTPSKENNTNSNPSSGQKKSQIQMTNDTQSTIPSQSKLTPSSLNDTEFNNDFFYESETQSKSQVENESDKEQANKSAKQGVNETFHSSGHNDDDDVNQSQKAKKSVEIIDDKKTPPNNKNSLNPKSTETKKLKTELAESAQKVKQSIKQSASKQQQQQQQKQQQQKQQQQSHQPSANKKVENNNQQVISPPIRDTTESPMVSGSQSPSPLASPQNSSSGSFHDQEQVNNTSKNQTAGNITKTEDQLSSVSLHLSSERPVKKIVPKMAIEIGVENAFDTASSQFQRLFLNEFASLMRPTYQMPFDSDIDNFIDHLSKDVNKELSSITKSYSPTSKRIRGISEKIELMFDQGKDALNEKLANSYEDDLQRRALSYQKLKNLKSLIDDLNKTFSTKVEKTMKVIDNCIKDSAMVRSQRLMKAQMMQKNLRELTLERMHLEAKVNKQLNEFEDIDRRQNEVIMSYISLVNNGDLYDDDDKRTIIMKKISRSISLISSDIDRVALDGLIEMTNDGQFMLNDERAKIREEYARLDGLADKLKLLKQEHISKKSSKRKDSKKKKI